ncbi:histidine phosphatase superfamily [Apodospora peruviana]|uniref:3-phytase n=1 Tax=Apodospora peruviana TaxID=516989 RepID=A0AAE0ICH3_9PEZI|nr:histidine phosphatase superfamily [Apodospora peruviana]
MTTLVPRVPYTDDELRKLYPSGLELQLVQILMRHGERTPVSARFQNAGLQPFWPYCSSARQMKSTILANNSDGATPFNMLEWRRRLETFAENDEPIVATGPKGELDNVCDMGSLTDVGRQSTSKLGMRFRELYVDRLKFLPPQIDSTDFMYLRSTPVPRALESLHQAFSGLYPPSTWVPDSRGKFPVPTILTRAPGDETLFPNDGNCRRFAALSRAFAQRTADRWNKSEQMEYLNQLYGKWMPANSPRVAVDSRPRLSGIMDTINATLAHGPETRLPSEFYDKKGREIIEKIGCEEWFSGYKESREYRMLGMGGLLGDIVGRMVRNTDPNTAEGRYELHRKAGQGHPHIKFGLSGCHDTTLAGVLASLGAYDTDAWPPYTSHVAFEMFRKSDMPPPTQPAAIPLIKNKTWRETLLYGSGPGPDYRPTGIGRKPTSELTPAERGSLNGYYVRVRYNDEPVTIPGCRIPGNHLEGDESFCTLAAFKEIVDKFTPRNWKQQCRENLDMPTLPKDEPEWAGH